MYLCNLVTNFLALSSYDNIQRLEAFYQPSPKRRLSTKKPTIVSNYISSFDTNVVNLRTNSPCQTYSCPTDLCHHRGPIVGSHEIPRTSQHYSIEGIDTVILFHFPTVPEQN